MEINRSRKPQLDQSLVTAEEIADFLVLSEEIDDAYWMGAEEQDATETDYSGYSNGRIYPGATCRFTRRLLGVA